MKKFAYLFLIIIFFIIAFTALVTEKRASTRAQTQLEFSEEERVEIIFKNEL
mgnify:CR=1 FL=1|tara:strand:- start:551 stop:706 length:156 start_codon:yes stop_codon:yes gene_type:complete